MSKSILLKFPRCRTVNFESNVCSGLQQDLLSEGWILSGQPIRIDQIMT